MTDNNDEARYQSRVGHIYDAWDGKTYRIASHDPQVGYWVEELGNPSNRRDISERALGSTFHHSKWCTCETGLAYPDGLTVEDFDNLRAFDACAYDLYRVESNKRGRIPTTWLATSEHAKEEIRRHFHLWAVEGELPVADEGYECFRRFIDAKVLWNGAPDLVERINLWRNAEAELKRQFAAGNPRAAFAESPSHESPYTSRSPSDSRWCSPRDRRRCRSAPRSRRHGPASEASGRCHCSARARRFRGEDRPCHPHRVQPGTVRGDPRGRLVRLWTCPNGCPAKRGPERPRRNATVRYCLSCSLKSDVLVERVCKSVERKREQNELRRKQRRKSAGKRQQRTLEARYTIDGVDLRDLWDRMLRLPSTHFSCATATMKVRHAKECPRTRIGTAWYGQNRIQVTIWPGRRALGCVRTMLHELAHLVSYARYGRQGRGHGDRFKGIFNDLVADWRTKYPEFYVGDDPRYTVAADPSEDIA